MGQQNGRLVQTSQSLEQEPLSYRPLYALLPCYFGFILWDVFLILW
jgi:hypothetical protein